MAFIKTQKIIRDETGKIISGSAAIVDAVYVHTGGKSHSKQLVREKLGKVYTSVQIKKVVFSSPQPEGSSNIMLLLTLFLLLTEIIHVLI